MKQAAPKWHKTITNYFKTHAGNGGVSDLLSNEKCIMGEAFKNDRWGDNAAKPCAECKYLGTEALELFSNFGKDVRVRLTDSEGWNNYQARFEYHWNNSHT
jgi:hypothetical protein